METGKRYCIEYLETLSASSWKPAEGPGFDTIEEALRARATADHVWPMARIWDRQTQQPVADAEDADRF